MSVPVIVTNKHVLKGATSIVIAAHFVDEAGDGPSDETADINLAIGLGDIVPHPDPDVDLCAVGVGEVLTPGGLNGRTMFATVLTSAIVPPADEWATYDALEEIVMVGCPNGLFDRVNALPIMRRGTTASHPAKLYEGRQEFMIDAACFPGSSGSPVYLFNHLGHLNKADNTFHMGAGRLRVLGVLYAGPTITQEGQIVLVQDPQVRVQAMMHLGTVIRSSRLLELAEAVRAKVVAQA